MNTQKRFRIPAMLVGLMATAGPTLAGTIIVPSFDRGWVRDDGRHQATNDNYYVGGNKSSQVPLELRNFFVFDLSVLTQEALTATFRVYNPSDGYDSPDTFETLELNSIDNTPYTDLFNDDPGIGAFADLADGITYGSGNIQKTDLDVFIDIPLNAAALFSINNTTKYFGFGGKLTTLDLTDLAVEKVLLNTGTSNPADGDSVLILWGPKIPAVPVPAALPLMLSALALAGLVMKKSLKR